jgi:hypothetical protein
MVLYAYLCCVCVFSLRRESPDMILGDQPLISDVVLSQGAERAVFERHEKLGQHMKPLYIKGYLDGKPVNQMLVDGGACVNIMPCAMFEKLGHKEEELMKMNMTLSGFSGEASNAKGIIAK